MNWKVRFNMPQAHGKRIRQTPSKSFSPIALTLAALLLATLLAACGTESPQLQLPTNTSGPGAATTSASSTVSATTASSTVPAASPTTAAPTVTPALVPVVQPPTTTPQATATALPPTKTPAAPTVASTVTTGPPATVATTPATTGTPAKVDAAVELKVIKAAYDAINEHYYTQPDTAKLAQQGLNTAVDALQVLTPDAPPWNSNPANNWQLFVAAFEKAVGESTVQLPPGDVAHRVANTFALAVGDLHTYFLDQTRTDTINRLSKGDNSTLGFGLYFALYQNVYFVTRMVTGSPAQLAGVQVGDQLVQFDGAAVNSTNITKISNSTENKTYTFVFKPLHGGANVTRQIEYKRYTVPTIEWKLLEGHIGFITINAFHLDVQARLDAAIASAKTQGADSLIIDLRYNGGGYNFDHVSGRFVADGTVLGTFTNRQGNSSIKARSDGKPVTTLPLVVLIDKGSASASEVFSLAVRDFNAGTLIGGRSIGAIGTVAYWPLGDGTSLGVTNSVYETVKGEKLNGVGITPDIEVARSTEDILNGRDPQLDAAVKEVASKAKVSN